jgi:hypothetical protein
VLHGLGSSSDSHSGRSMSASVAGDWEYEGPRRTAAYWGDVDHDMGPGAAADLVRPPGPPPPPG